VTHCQTSTRAAGGRCALSLSLAGPWSSVWWRGCDLWWSGWRRKGTPIWSDHFNYDSISDKIQSGSGTYLAFRWEKLFQELQNKDDILRSRVSVVDWSGWNPLSFISLLRGLNETRWFRIFFLGHIHSVQTNSTMPNFPLFSKRDFKW
jgi:hypothetical protein